MLRLAIPVLIQQLLHMLVGLVDTFLAGRFLEGNEHLAAIGLMSYVLWLVPSMFAAVAIGATAMVSRFVGAGDKPMAVRVTNQAFVTGVIFAVVVTASVALFGDWFVATVQLKAEAATLAIRYLDVLVFVVPAIMIEEIGIACLRGAGNTMSGLVAMTVVNIVNVAVSLCLVIGIGPFPQLGWEGLAIGTACGHAVGALIVVGLLIKGCAGLQVRVRMLIPDFGLVRRLLRVGLPGGFDILAILFCHLWFLSIINTLGTLPAAAHSLGVRIESLAYLPGTAFQVAAATLAGQFLGAGEFAKATRSVLLALLVGGAILVIAGIGFFFGAEWLTAQFLGEDNRQAAEVTVPLLRLVAFTMPSLALTMILTGALRGAGDTRWPILFTFIGFLGIRIPLAYLLAWERIEIPVLGVTIDGYGLGVFGAWCAMAADIGLRSLLVLWRFLHGGWKKAKV